MVINQDQGEGRLIVAPRDVKQDGMSTFERHPIITLVFVYLIFLVLFFASTEVLLAKFTGLGSPILFYKNPSFGYRMLPDQETYRFSGAHFKINNIGLRANEDWDARIEGKILFLGDSVTYGGNHISNEDLFSYIAVDGEDELKSGNAGIPNWGVENVYGLVVEEKFLPAIAYVSTFIEHDFYRGLTSGTNKPWIRYEPPRFALQELFNFLWHKYLRNPRDYIKNTNGEGKQREARVGRAAKKLKQMDNMLREKGYSHLIFISPTRKQVLLGTQKNQLVESELKKYNIPVIYLLDKLNSLDASEEQKRSWYQDKHHLTIEGHRVWGALIRQELISNGIL